MRFFFKVKKYYDDLFYFLVDIESKCMNLNE